MHHTHARLRALVLLVVALSSCGPRSHDRGDPADAATDAESPRSEREALLDALDRGEPRIVLVVGRGDDQGTLRQAMRSHVSREDVVLEATRLPITAVRVRDRQTLAEIEALDRVERVEPERFHTADAIPSLELIGQPAALARGADGRGRSVAVLDTGADYTRAAFGSCAAAGPDCGVVYAQDFAPSDGVPDDPSSMHGTNVSGIVRLVAPSARVVALDVFSGSTASSTHIVAALDWVIANRDVYTIAAVNMSLGYGGFTSPCPTDVLAVAVQRVRDAGIVPVIASGNGSLTNAISSPACAPAAVSVGAVDRADVPASFSNSSSFLTVMAPGTIVEAAGITMSGTSQATPHVAGSIAALLTAYPSDGPSDLVARLVGTGISITDRRNGLTFRRISLDAATVGGATSPPPDITPPTGSLRLASDTVRTASVAFTLEATDASGVSGMCVSSGTSCTTFVPFATSGVAMLASGDGSKTVRVWLRDAAGNTTTTPLSATVLLDTRAPSGGSVTATTGIRRVTLVTTGTTDTGSGLATYRASFSTGASAPSTCALGTLLPESSTGRWTHEGLVPGTTYRYRACAVDRAGNVAAGLTAQAIVVEELDPPTGTIVIEGGREWARTARVSVQLTASDASTVTHVCLSPTTTCTAWVAFAATVTGTLGAGAGPRPLNAWFRDRWGNTSSAPVSDTILLDTVVPASPGVVVQQRDGALALRWAEGTDAPSGLLGYVVTSSTGATAPACTAVPNVAAATAGTREHVLSGLVNGVTVRYRVCAIDVAGNVSAGTVGAAIPAPETTPPSPGSIRVAADAEWTRTRAVPVTLSATDPSGVAQVCLSTSTTCTAWVPYASSVTFTLATTAGTQTVRAWFRDSYGNTTVTPISDTIGYDAVAPSSPAVTAVPRSGAVDLSFAVATDSGSGVMGYLLAWSTGTTSPACSVDGARSYVLTDPRVATLSSTVPIAYRVCARDRAGNVSAGLAGRASPLP